MIYIKGDEAAYLWWLEANATGFVANLGTGGKGRAMLHTTRCWHLYPPETNKVHTVAYAKACSNDRNEVEQWALANGFAVVPCPDCKP